MVFGTSSSLGSVLVPILKQNGHEVVSVGRRHHVLADDKIDWLLPHSLPSDEKFDLIFFLILDYSSIKRKNLFKRNNLEVIETMLRNPGYRQKLVIPTSLSGTPNSLSRYGQLKFLHRRLANENSIRTLQVGWLDIPSNGGKITQVVIAILRKLNLNILPNGGYQSIFLSQVTDIQRGMSEILAGEMNVVAHRKSPISLSEFIFGQFCRNPIRIGFLAGLLLRIIPVFYSILPKGLVRSIDSARSML